MKGIKQALVFLWGVLTAACLTTGLYNIDNDLIALLIVGIISALVAVLCAVLYVADHWND